MNPTNLDDQDDQLAGAYRVLGVSPDCDESELRARFRRHAKRLHPDHNPDPGATDRFRQIEHAYRTILAARTSGLARHANREHHTSPARSVDDPDIGDIDWERVRARQARAHQRITQMLDTPTEVRIDAATTAWALQLRAGPLVHDAFLVHDGCCDRYAVAPIRTCVDHQPLTPPDTPWGRPTPDGLLPLCATGWHPDPELLTDRLGHWLARVAWFEHRLAPDPWDPRTDLATWAHHQLAWILPLVAIPADETTTALLDHELDQLVTYASRATNLDRHTATTYLHQLVCWVLTTDTTWTT